MLLQSSVYNLQKTKFRCINICFMIIIELKFWRQCEIHQRQFRIPLFFCILFSTPFNKTDLILATQSKFLFESNYLKSTKEGLSFQTSFVPKASITWYSLPILLLIESTRSVNVPWSI